MEESFSNHGRRDTVAAHTDSAERIKTWTQWTGAQPAEEFLLNTHAKEVQRNRSALQSIIKTLVLCGQQGIALRNHCDDGDLFKDMNENEGNFQALLEAQIDAGDSSLANHFSRKHHKTNSFPALKNVLWLTLSMILRSSLALGSCSAFALMKSQTIILKVSLEFPFDTVTVVCYPRSFHRIQ